MTKKSRSRPKLSPEDAELFRTAVSKVHRLDHEPRASQPRQKPEKRSPKTNQRVAEGVTREEGELFYRADLPTGMFRELRQGYFRPSATIDLHGQTVAQAESELINFIQHHTDFDPRCLLVITGKGSHSPEGYSPVRFAALELLQKQPWVHAYCWARPKDGGTGAFYVLTRKIRS